GSAGSRRAIERHEVGPGLLETKAHPILIHDLHRPHLGLEQARTRAAVAIEGELHVLRGERITVLEADALAQGELVDEPVAAHLPRLRERRPHARPGQRPHQRIVHRVVHHEGQRGPRGIRRIKERRRQRHMHPPAHHALRPPPAPRTQHPNTEQGNSGGNHKTTRKTQTHSLSIRPDGIGLLKRVQMRGSARRPRARRTPGTLSPRPRALTKQMDPFQQPGQRPVYGVSGSMPCSLSFFLSVFRLMPRSWAARTWLLLVSRMTARRRGFSTSPTMSPCRLAEAWPRM